MTMRQIVLSLMVALILVAGSSAQEPELEVVIKVNGMFCPFCTFGIEKRLKKLPETASVRTDLAAGEAIVTLKPGAEFIEQHFDDAIKRAGFSQSGIALRPATDEVSAAGSLGTAPRSEVIHAPMKLRLTHIKTIGGPGEKPGEFAQPMSIAFAPDGWFVVTDAGAARVQQFHPDGSPWRQWSVMGDGQSPLLNPVGIAIGAQGEIWVSDYEADTISHYGPDGKPLGVFGQSGSEEGDLDAPSGVAITSEGEIAVADFYNHRVQLFSPEGKFIRALGAHGMFRRFRSAGLNYPTRVTAAADGTLWVADAYNYRVVSFDRDGKLGVRLGKKGHKPGQFEVSAGIAMLPENRLIVADFMNHRLQLWTTRGKPLGDFGVEGAQPGQFERPIDVALAPDGNLYVVDWGNNRVQVFSVEEPRE